MHKGLYRTGPDGRGAVILVAVKQALPSASSMLHDELMAEAVLMAQFAHPNVCALHGVYFVKDCVHLVLEYCEMGNLRSYLRSKGSKQEHDFLLSVARDVADALGYLTSNKFVHRDVAARNILLSTDLSAKVADFGLSRNTDNAEYYRSQSGQVPVRWSAPEALEHLRFTTKSDCWSYGIVLYELWSGGAMPYDNWSNQKVWVNVMAGYRMPAPIGCPPDVYAIMLQCWDSEPARRPDFADLEVFFATKLGEEDYRRARLNSQFSMHDQHYYDERLAEPRPSMQLLSASAAAALSQQQVLRESNASRQDAQSYTSGPARSTNGLYDEQIEPTSSMQALSSAAAAAFDQIQREKRATKRRGSNASRYNHSGGSVTVDPKSYPRSGSHLSMVLRSGSQSVLRHISSKPNVLPVPQESPASSRHSSHTGGAPHLGAENSRHSSHSSAKTPYLGLVNEGGRVVPAAQDLAPSARVYSSTQSYEAGVAKVDAPTAAAAVLPRGYKSMTSRDSALLTRNSTLWVKGERPRSQIHELVASRSRPQIQQSPAEAEPMPPEVARRHNPPSNLHKAESARNSAVNPDPDVDSEYAVIE